MKIWKVKTVCCEYGPDLENELNKLEASKRVIKEVIHKGLNYYQIIYTEEDIMEVNE